MWEEKEISKMTIKGVPFPMLSDACATIGKEYGVFMEDASINTRGSFIIDPEGNIQSIEVLSPPVGRNYDETLRQIKALQHVRATEGAEATPVGWQPGKAVLQPGPQLVGKVWENWKSN